MARSFSVAILAAVCLLLACQASGHSQMTEPQSISPFECRLGGQASYGYGNCHGPCDTTFIDFGGANFGSPSNPAATYRRGQIVNVKYTRNNHAPGGFNRLTLVPVDKMMDKAAHAAGAFHYSCWGAGVTVANLDQITKDPKGFNIVGVDGQQHHEPPAFYSTDTTIPDVIPDGNYIFGWAWFGGTGGTLQGRPDLIRNDASTPANNKGFFGDVRSFYRHFRISCCFLLSAKQITNMSRYCPPIFLFFFYA
jgi:hypothetical protein